MMAGGWLERMTERVRIALPALALALVAVALNLWALERPWRFDLTHSGVYSIGPETRRVIERLERPVEITFFYTVNNRSLSDAKLLLEQYAQASPKIHVQAFDPVLQPAQARRYDVRFPGTAVFEVDGRRTVINGGTEADFTNGLLRAQRGAERQVCFSQGHREADPMSMSSHDHFEGNANHDHSTGGRLFEVHERHGAGMARQALETLGYQVRKVLLLKGPDALLGCDVLMVVSPQAEFLPAEVSLLRDWLAHGGQAAFLLEPFGRAALAPVLADFGVHHDGNRVLDDKSHYWTDPGTPAVSSYANHRITRDLPLSFFPGVSSLSPIGRAPPEGVRVVPLVSTSDQARVERVAGMDSSVDDDARSRTLMVLASRPAIVGAGAPEKRAQILVSGDGDFATNSFYPVLGNGQLLLNIVSQLAEHEQLIDIVPRSYELPSIRLTNTQMRLTFFLSAVMMPVLVLGFALWQRWRRRR